MATTTAEAATFARMHVRMRWTGTRGRSARRKPNPLSSTGPADPSRKAKNREGRRRGSDVSTAPKSGIQRSRKVSVGVRLGNQASRQVLLGTQGTDRGRKAPAGTFRGERSRLHRYEWPPGKVGVGGNTSPHFHIRAPDFPRASALSAASAAAPTISRLSPRPRFARARTSGRAGAARVEPSPSRAVRRSARTRPPRAR
jgi:hypothetical protein